MKISTITKERFNEIHKTLDPVLLKLNRNFYDFLDRSGNRHLRRIIRPFSISFEELLACKGKVKSWRTGALLEQEADFAKRHDPAMFPVYAQAAERNDLLGNAFVNG